MIGNILNDTTHQSQPSFAEVTAKAVARSIEQTRPQEQHKPDASATGEIASALWHHIEKRQTEQNNTDDMKRTIVVTGAPYDETTNQHDRRRVDTTFAKELDSTTCPTAWKYADITPIFKKGDPSQAHNYRPISILPAMCKLFERILTEDIYDHLCRNHLITSAQYGFIKGRSTELQLLNCSCDWVNAIDTKLFADTAYIDLAKAFDTVSHNKLLYKLHKYGITGDILQLFSSYLDNRKQRVKLGNTFSSYADVTSGVPQGSCTGPLLFILYVNDLPDNQQPTNITVNMFADDTKFTTVFSEPLDRVLLQNCLSSFTDWADLW